jgi:hypothetical protein
VLLLGCIALRFPGTELQWDAHNARFTNHAEANRWLAAVQRDGFKLQV